MPLFLNKLSKIGGIKCLKIDFSPTQFSIVLFLDIIQIFRPYKLKILWKPVKNKSKGRFGYRPEAIIIHSAEGHLDKAYEWFNDPSSQVSSHYMIGKNGAVWQFVNSLDTAWHAGFINKPSWNLLKPKINPNLYTIGIKHEGFTGEPWTNAMYESSSKLIALLCQRFKIPLDRNHIIGHNQINSVTRSKCPGTGVNFKLLIQKAEEKLGNHMAGQELNKKILLLETKISDLISENEKFSKKNKQLQNLIKDYTDTSFKMKDLKNTNSILKNRINDITKENKKLSTRLENYENNENEQEQEKWWEVLINFVKGV